MLSFLGILLFRELLALTNICPFLRPCFDFPLKLLALGFYKSVFHTRRVGFGFSEQRLASTEAGNAEGNESVRLIFFSFKCLFQIWEEVEWFLSISSLASGTSELREAQRPALHHTSHSPAHRWRERLFPRMHSLPSALRTTSFGAKPGAWSRKTGMFRSIQHLLARAKGHVPTGISP